MIKKIYPETHEEWLRQRAEGIGASEIGAVVGVSKFQTPAQLYHRKRAERAGELAEVQTKAMQRGHILEDAVANYWQAVTGRTFIKASAKEFIVKNDIRPYLQASPDRTYWPEGATHNEESKCILECKTTNMTISPNPETGELGVEDIPLYWQYQLQWLMAATGYRHASIAVLGARYEFGWRDFDFDEGLVNDLFAVADDFWDRCILGGQEPDPISEEDLLARYPESNGTMIEATPEVAGIVAQLRETKAKAKEYNDAADELETTIKGVFGQAEKLMFMGETLATWKSSKPGRKLDTKALKAAHPDLVAQFEIETPSTRRFLLK